MSRPLFRLSADARLRANRPAPATRTIATATWAITSAARVRRCVIGGVAPPRDRRLSDALALNPKVVAIRDINPDASSAAVVAAATARLSSDSPSQDTSTPPGSWKAATPLKNHQAMGLAMIAPAPPSRAASMAIPPASRARVAPNATHSASSVRRASVRINRSIPTVPHPISSSSPTVAASSRANWVIAARARAGTVALLIGVSA